MNDNAQIEHIFGSLRTHVLHQITLLPRGADGHVNLTGPQLGIAILAASLQLAEELKCTRADIDRCVTDVLAPKLVL